MARSDYAHWNEEADAMWWAEEGRFQGTESEREYDPDDFLDPGDDDWCSEHKMPLDECEELHDAAEVANGPFDG